VNRQVNVPEDLAEFVFDTRDVIPLTELADSFKALDSLFAQGSRSGARLAIAEIRKGSIVALLAPFVPIMGHSVSFMASAIEVSDFVKRLRDALNAFAGRDRPDGVPTPTADTQVAADIAALVKPLAGRAGSRFDVAHIKYRSRNKERVVEVEASYGPAEIDRIAVNATRAGQSLPSPVEESACEEVQPSLLRKVVLSLQQTNTGPAKEKGKTGDRGVIQSISDKPLAVYFAKTLEDLKQKMVGRSSNPFRQPFKVDVLVSYEDGEAKSYTVIDVHGAYRPRKKRGPPDLLTGIT
jgi:hypothetical protein